MTEIAVPSSVTGGATAISVLMRSGLVLMLSGAGTASAMSATIAGESLAAIGTTSMLPPCGKGLSRVNAHFTAGMRRSNDISLESTGSCPSGTRREAIADSPAMQKNAPAVTSMSM
ncbi:hypothetical protein HAP41_0000014840 [Bradyrhizobium barranii subsp. apii]|uniref:Uncharacterized protein n=1 Tax=Bradyrhizobium barranii subsp. apii TaxID=2819348 RepID=A0A8T5VQQ6_9BRAD|nr:hypothetical protein [Bradyrhizobium barranii]UPT92085.1 hypothetical protein HAP41_0000014840 [Bradyrhizobium barranii subsp. apii]